MFKRIATYKITTIITCTLSILNAMFYFSMRCIWSGIGKVLNGNQMIPLVIMGVFVLVAIIAWVLAWLRKEKILMYITLFITLVLDVGLFFIIKLGASDYLLFILRDFLDCLLYGIAILLVVWIIYFYSDSKLTKMKVLKSFILILIIFGSLVCVLNIGINRLDLKPTVYVVDEEYQIVFTTTTDSAVSIEIGEETYYDLYAGSQKSESKVHKVIVPMSSLDEVKKYTINIQQILMRGPFGGFKGENKTYDFNFKPVDTTDGFDYYTISDIHGKKAAGIKTASYLGEKLDLLIMIGDISSYLERERDIELIGRVAYEVTKGELPVIYARGNHETKGTLADQLYRYVGSKNEKFYFTFKLENIWGVVLDGGEDHNDDWWEFYGLAHFKGYRDEQTSFLEEIIAGNEYMDDEIKYKMAICHFVIPYVNKSGFLADVKDDWTKLLNEIDIDVSYSGHEHELIPIIPGTFTPYENLIYKNTKYTTKSSVNEGYFTDAQFPTFIVSKHDDVQNIDRTQSQLDGKMCGVASHVDASFTKLTLCYTNRYLEKMEMVDPFSAIEYGTEIIINLE